MKTITHNKLYIGSHFAKTALDALGLCGAPNSHDKSLDQCMQWIAESFNATLDGGSSAGYAFQSGWLNSYPETTGYLIPTMLEYAAYSGDGNWTSRALAAADWLVEIQSKEGGWQGLQVGQPCDLRVFNTGMIVDGLIAAYVSSGEAQYLDAAIQAVRWTIGKLDDDGHYSENNIVGGGAFDTLVNACLLMAIQHLPESEATPLKQEVMRSLNAQLTLQNQNGTFQRCSFKFEDKCLLHHVGYTLDGLVISAELLDDERYYHSAKKTAAKLLSKFEVEGELPALINHDWTTHNDLGNKGASLCLTGYSQVAIVFFKIFKRDRDHRYRNAALKLVDTVAAISNYHSSNKGISYGVPGAYPINGWYHQYELVNWAAKYHAESILLSLNKEISKAK